MNDTAATWHDKAMAIGLDPRSKKLREGIIRTLGYGKRGHIGASMSLVEILRVLYDDILSYRAVEPMWRGRDRCILSKGHGCLAQYVLLADKGFIDKDELRRFCHLDGLLGGHPDATKIPGVEASTGSLGHGFSIGLGMALWALRKHPDVRVYVVLGDGECDEGTVWEAAMSAAKHGLENLTVMVDYNKYQSYGSTFIVQDLEPFAAKWSAFGFDVHEANGHSTTELRDVLKLGPVAGRPRVVICHTVKGKGIDFAENDLRWHHKSSIGSDDVECMLLSLERYPCEKSV